MKALYLKKLLNTERVVADYGDYIAVGSGYVHKLINIDKKTLTLKYALDTFNEGRKSLTGKSDNELLDIWDKLQSLIDSGEINEIINGNDEIENPLTVWTYENGEIVETYTYAYGYPNTTHDGKLMHDNVYFKTKEEAIEEAISEHSYQISFYERRIKEIEDELSKFKNKLDEQNKYVKHFKSLQK